MTEDALLTSAQVGELLGKSGRTVHRMVTSGRLRPVQKLPGVRGALLFDRRDIEPLVRAREAQLRRDLRAVARSAS